MKNILIIAIASSFVLSNVFAQSFMSNTVSECKMEAFEIDRIWFAMNRISDAYNVRICSEFPYAYKTPKWPKTNMTFTNETFGNVFGTLMQATTNLVWRYENNTDSIYVYPSTNSITQMRIGPIPLTNEPVWKIFFDDEMETMKIDGLDLGGRESDSWNMLITLDMGESYLWEVIDAAMMQIPDMISWDIREILPQEGSRYILRYFTKQHAYLGYY